MLKAVHKIVIVLFFLFIAIGNSLSDGRAEAGDYSIRRNVVFAEHDSGALRADLYVPESESPKSENPKSESLHPAVLVVHGGGWVGGNRRQLGWIARMLAKQGFVAMAINYRLAPMHKFPAQIDDCKQAVKWLHENAETYHVDTDRIAAWGYSAGGHLVALLAVASPGLKAVIAGGAPYDFREVTLDNPMFRFWLGATRGENPDIYNAASPAHFVSNHAPAFFIYHGRNDLLVPPIQATQMAHLLQAAGVTAELVWTETGHVRGLFQDDVTEQAVAFLKDHLRGEGDEAGAAAGQ